MKNILKQINLEAFQVIFILWWVFLILGVFDFFRLQNFSLRVGLAAGKSVEFK